MILFFFCQCKREDSKKTMKSETSSCVLIQIFTNLVCTKLILSYHTYVPKNCQVRVGFALERFRSSKTDGITLG